MFGEFTEQYYPNGVYNAEISKILWRGGGEKADSVFIPTSRTSQNRNGGRQGGEEKTKRQDKSCGLIYTKKDS